MRGQQTERRTAVILTALELEYTAVRAHLEGLEERTEQGTVYEVGNFSGERNSWMVAIAQTGAGNPSASLEVERATRTFHPDAMLFVGIAGGLKDVALGDVVAADAVYGYESGKAGQDYAPRIKTDRSAYALVQRARVICRSADWQARIQPSPSGLPSKAFVGPIAAGEKVVTDFASVVGQLIRASCGDALAVEMEGAGFLYGAWANAARLAMVVRGISDLVLDKNAEHDRKWQPIAARHAAAFAFELLDHYGAQGSPAPPGLVRTTRLEELERACRARMVGSWQALGVPRQLAIQLAEDPAVGRPPDAAVPLPGGVRLLLGDMGAGKTLMGERLHQAALTRARQDAGAPVPIYLTARRAREGLREAVEAEAQGLGHPRRQGAVVVVDGADEAGADVAADLLDEARRLVIEWPRTSVVLASRLLPYLSEAEEGWTVPPLTNDEAELLLARIEGGRQGSFRGLTGLPPAVRDAVHRPLFAVLLGTFLLGESGRLPRSRSELVRSLVDRSLRRTAGRWRHAQTLLERLAQLTIDRAGAVLATEVGPSKDREALIATGLVAEHSGALSFPLPILEQWFAAHLLLGDPKRTATLAKDLQLLERWRYAIVLALAEANQGVATQLLQPIVLEQPAMASTLVHEGLADRREDDTLPLPPSRECGEQVRATMAAWVEGIGPLVELVAPVDSDGRLLPLGARSDGVRLLTAWYQGNEPKHDVEELEVNEVLLSPQRSGWILGPDGVPSRSAGWAWHWTFKQLSREIRELVQKRRLPIHEGPLADEANWRLARSLAAGIPRSPHPSPIPLSPIEARLAQVSDTTALVVRGHGTLKAAGLKAWLQRLQAMGIETVAYPWPGPDLDPDPQASASWDWEFYSDPRLLEWAQAVYAGALRGYQDLVEQWFAPFAPRLRTAALLPARLVGAVDPPTRDGTGKDMPGITWYLEPLPVGSTTHVELAIGEHPGFTWEDMKQASHRFRRLRPQASPWLGGSWHESVIPNLFAPDPATSLAYDWLRNDLRDTHWIS
jgi:nucleoside phosphorylase